MARLFRVRGLGELTRQLGGGGGLDDSGLVSPFGEVGCSLSDEELRETAYEVFVGTCKATGGKPLTFISQSERSNSEKSLSPSVLGISTSLQRSLTSTAASKVKKALGLKLLLPSTNTRPVDGVGIEGGHIFMFCPRGSNFQTT